MADFGEREGLAPGFSAEGGEIVVDVGDGVAVGVCELKY